MQGNPEVIATLNEALKEELTAINQYFLHAEMCENWKYDKLGDFIKKQSIDEMKHAEEIIERILFLDGTPNLTELMQLNIGENVKAQLENDLKLESNAVQDVQQRGEIARDEGRQRSPRTVRAAAEGRGEARRLAGSATSPDQGNRLRTLPDDAARRARVSSAGGLRQVKRTLPVGW